MSDKEFISRIYLKNDYNSIEDNPIFLSGQKNRTDISQKKIQEWAINTWENAESPRKCKLKPQLDLLHLHWNG